MQVIIDLPINHTSIEHPWFIEAQDNPDAERRDWYLWSQDKPEYLGPWGQEVWHPSTSGYYYGLFWSGMPDLNLENPQVTAEMENVARFWLEDMGVDGFRMDAARHLIEEGSLQENTAATHEWWENFRPVYKTANPEALAVGEIWTNNAAVASYVEGDELDLAFDFDLAQHHQRCEYSGCQPIQRHDRQLRPVRQRSLGHLPDQSRHEQSHEPARFGGW
jgi:glycosidase